MTETEAAAAANGAEATEKKPDLSPEHLAKIDRQINVRISHTACKFFELFSDLRFLTLRSGAVLPQICS